QQRVGRYGFHEDGRDAQRLHALPGFGVAAAGDDEHGDGGERLDLAQALPDQNPIAGGESQVEQDEVGALAVHDGQGRGGVGRPGDDVAVGLEPRLDVRASDRVVLNDEDFLAAGASAPTGRFHPTSLWSRTVIYLYEAAVPFARVSPRNPRWRPHNERLGGRERRDGPAVHHVIGLLMCLGGLVLIARP